MADRIDPDRVAADLLEAFAGYDETFRTITRRARSRFETRDWAGGRADALERIELWGSSVAATVRRMSDVLGAHAEDRELWNRVKKRFRELVADRIDAEFSKTYFSSVTRRLFHTVGVDPEIEFAAAEAKPLQNVGPPVTGRDYPVRESLRGAVDELLADFALAVPYEDAARCADRVCDAITEHRREAADADSVLGIAAMDSVFYRETRAYIVARVTGWTTMTPLVLALENTENGVRVDAVIQTEQAVSILFGFTRSHFHVDLESVGAAIGFLRTLLPRKRLAELFTAVGQYKQGKTERYRDFVRHLGTTCDRFQTAPGDRGMVMLVFTLPSYDVVIKVIRDEFDYPKTATRAHVEAAYDLVFKHDKAGRLVDAQEFRSLELPRERFAPELLEELSTSCARTVRLEGEKVVIGHAYIERRLRPLNLYLREVDRRAAQRAVREYGQAIRDLAASNVFAGDMLLKNFGVSRHGRVLFYDYDELCLVTDCRFRELPEPTSYDEEIAAEPPFFVGEHDVFPEQFVFFLGLGDELHEVFVREHGELLTARYWRAVQGRVREDGGDEVLPYDRPANDGQRRAG